MLEFTSHRSFMRYIHKNNDPKYHALLLRAVEEAKHNEGGPAHILWMFAQDVPANAAELGKDAKQAAKKRNQWLQFNDQKTAGIPGLCPLYVNMRGRVMERISRKLNIQKHTPCTVIGWDLHPADRLRTDASQRKLEYLPRCIYVKFAGASWQVHPKLEQGVFPLKPVKREWILNRATDSRIKRKGFLLLPDLACTAHIVQGGNLDAEMTDCGDAFEKPPLKDMLSAYVALSRYAVQKKYFCYVHFLCSCSDMDHHQGTIA